MSDVRMKTVEAKLLDEIKAGARDLFQAVLDGSKKSKKYERRVIGNKNALGMTTSQGVVWCVPLDKFGSVLGIALKDMGLEAASLRYEDTSFMYLPVGRSCDVACVVQFPDGRMRLTTYGGVLSL